jgi:hypothetical protein
MIFENQFRQRITFEIILPTIFSRREAGMKIIFLDIDGVLNNMYTDEYTPDGFVGISTTLNERLGKIVKSDPDEIEVVLSSSWKLMTDEMADYSYMMEKLREVNAEPVGITEEPDDEGLLRAQGIIQYLEATDDVTGYVILDDYIFDFREAGLTPHLVLTDEVVGLTQEDVLMAIDILNGKLLPDDYYDEISKERGYYRDFGDLEDE